MATHYFVIDTCPSFEKGFKIKLEIQIGSPLLRYTIKTQMTPQHFFKQVFDLILSLNKKSALILGALLMLENALALEAVS